MKIKKELIKREIAGDTILIPIGKTIADSSGLFLLNEQGAFLWDIIPAAETEEELTEALLTEYEVDRETAEKDVREFLDRLREMSIL